MRNRLLLSLVLICGFALSGLLSNGLSQTGGGTAGGNPLFRLLRGTSNLTINANGSITYSVNGAAAVTLPAAGNAPVNAKYITQTPDATLTNEQALSLLGTGLVKNTTTTGVLSIAAAGTDYENPLTFSSPLVRSVNTISCATCALTSNPLSQFAATTSAQLAGVISDETGSGVLALASNPTLTGATLAHDTDLQLQTQGTIPFSYHTRRAVFNATNDDVSEWSYNQKADATQYDASEFSSQIRQEANYNSGVANYTEFNYDIQNPGGTHNRRWFYFKMDRSTLAGDWTWWGKNFSFQSYDSAGTDTPTEWLVFFRNTASVTGMTLTSQTGAQNNLTLNTTDSSGNPGAYTRFVLQRANVTKWLISNEGGNGDILSFQNANARIAAFVQGATGGLNLVNALGFNSATSPTAGLTSGTARLVKATDGGTGGGAVQVGDSTGQPTCSSATRGAMWTVYSAAGVGDIYQVCLKGTADTYAWRSVFTAP